MKGSNLHILNEMRGSKTTKDPMESAFQKACDDAGIECCRDDNYKGCSGLDFYLPGHDVYVEVKQMHTPRIAEQMSRKDNIIVLQGLGAVRAFHKIAMGEPA